MRFRDIYSKNGGPVISFEVFPPKTDAAYDNLLQILPDLVGLRPQFMTVTYGAMGSTRDRTLEIAALIKQKYSLATACHLTCVGSSRPELNQILADIHKTGVQNIVALRGDPPSGQMSFSPPPDGFSHANQLVGHIRTLESSDAVGPFGIAVAGYPEKHVEAPSMEADLAHLKRKVDSGADCVITQLFYDNTHYFRFVDQARALGIKVPIVPGLLPVLSVKQVVRITGMCGACLPADLRNDLENVGDDAAQAEQIGIRQCVKQARELIAGGAPGIHFYVLNRSTHMKEIMKQVNPISR